MECIASLFWVCNEFTMIPWDIKHPTKVEDFNLAGAETPLVDVFGVL